MGCQLGPHVAALQQIQKAYAGKGVLLVGVDRLEHPYDVEDYCRHFGLTFPVFVDQNEESPGALHAKLGRIVVLDRIRQGAGWSLDGAFDGVDTPAALDKILASTPAQATGPAYAPGILRKAAYAQGPVAPRMQIPGWSQPVRIGAGSYPKIISYGGDKALCVWVTGDLPQQQLEYALCSAGQWQNARPIRTGPDASGVALDVDSQGRPVIAWAQKDAQAYRICFSTLEGQEWREPVSVSPPENDAFRPDILSRSGGQLSVAWYAWKRIGSKNYSNAWSRSIYVSQFVDGKAGAPQEMSQLRRTSADCWDPVFAGTGTDLQTCWLCDENPPKLWWSASGANGWSPSEALLRPAADPKKLLVRACSPVRSSNGRSGLVFELNSSGQAGFSGGTQVYLATFANSRWNEPVVLSRGAERNVAPVGAELSGGKTIVFWCQMPGKNVPATIRMQEIRSGVLPGPDRAIVSAGLSSRYPAVAADPAGNLWLAWQTDEPNASPSIYVSRSFGQTGR